MNSCPECGSEYFGYRCRCGFTVKQEAPKLEHAAPKYLSREERLKAYERNKATLNALKKTTEPWNRERFTAHYQRIVADKNAAPWAQSIAAEALRNFGVFAPPVEEPVMNRIPLPEEREPGCDDALEEALADMANP
jgi:hypothetical protein